MTLPRLLAAALVFAALPAFADDAPPAETAAPKAEAPAAPAETLSAPAETPKAEPAPVEPKAQPAAIKVPTPAAAKPPVSKTSAAILDKLPAPVEMAPRIEPWVPSAQAPKAPEAFKPIGAAAPYETLLGAYGEAKDKFLQWLKDASAQAKDINDREEALKKDISAKEAETTKLKLDNTKGAKEQVKELSQQTKQLWRDLDKLQAEKTALKRTLAHGAASKVRELNAEILERAGQAQQAE